MTSYNIVYTGKTMLHPMMLTTRYLAPSSRRTHPPPALTPELLAPALSGGPGAKRQLAEAMIPTIQVRVGRLLLRAGALRGRDGSQEIKDFVQAVLLALFDKDC